MLTKSEVGICKSILLNETIIVENCLERISTDSADLSNADISESIYCCNSGRDGDQHYHYHEYCCTYSELVSQHRYKNFI